MHRGMTCLLHGQEFIGMLRDMQSLQCRRIMVLVTTRKSVGDSFGLADVLDLPALCSKSAEALLVAFAGRNIEWRKDDASKLVSICGSNPLALEILAGFIKSKLCTPQVRLGCLPCQEPQNANMSLINDVTTDVT